MNFDWIVKHQVGAMSMPWPEEAVELRRLGVTAVLSLAHGAPTNFAEAGLKHLVLPIRDFHPPTPAQLDAAVEFVEMTVGAGGACAVHCQAGLGRTGTVIAAWLVRRGRAPQEAIEEVRRVRPGSVETRAQEESVAAYARALARRTGGLT